MFQPDLDESSMEYQVGKELNSRGLTISCAESCTGGLLSARLTAIPGSSAYVMGGVVSYCNQVKEKQLGVSHHDLETVGSVSEMVARQMAEGVQRQLGTDIGVGITGIAGPGGATEDKPLGLVYIAVSGHQGTTVTRNVFTGDRQQVRWQSTEKALSMVLEQLQN